MGQSASSSTSAPARPQLDARFSPLVTDAAIDVLRAAYHTAGHRIREGRHAAIEALFTHLVSPGAWIVASVDVPSRAQVARDWAQWKAQHDDDGIVVPRDFDAVLVLNALIRRATLPAALHFNFQQQMRAKLDQNNKNSAASDSNNSADAVIQQQHAMTRAVYRSAIEACLRVLAVDVHYARNVPDVLNAPWAWPAPFPMHHPGPQYTQDRTPPPPPGAAAGDGGRNTAACSILAHAVRCDRGLDIARAILTIDAHEPFWPARAAVDDGGAAAACTAAIAAAAAAAAAGPPPPPGVPQCEPMRATGPAAHVSPLWHHLCNVIDNGRGTTFVLPLCDELVSRMSLESLCAPHVTHSGLVLTSPVATMATRVLCSSYVDADTRRTRVAFVKTLIARCTPDDGSGVDLTRDHLSSDRHGTSWAAVAKTLGVTSTLAPPLVSTRTFVSRAASFLRAFDMYHDALSHRSAVSVQFGPEEAAKLELPPCPSDRIVQEVLQLPAQPRFPDPRRLQTCALWDELVAAIDAATNRVATYRVGVISAVHSSAFGSCASFGGGIAALLTGTAGGAAGTGGGMAAAAAPIVSSSPLIALVCGYALGRC